MTTTAPKFDFEQLTLGEVATIEDLSGFGIGALNQGTPQGKFLAAIYMVVQRRSGDPTFTFNQALAVPMVEAQKALGFTGDDDEDEADENASAEGNAPTSDEPVTV